MTDVPQRPKLRAVMKVLWGLVTGKTERDFVKMGRVRPELMRVVYSHLTDAEAAARIEGLVRSNPEAGDATLRCLREAMQLSRDYDADRAYRILKAAMKGTAPEPMRPQDVRLFERERELGWLPLIEGFARLRAAVPELADTQACAEELAACPEDLGIVHDLDENVIVVPSGVLPTAHGLVGPDSRHPDPLIRSSIAATVAARYVSAVLTRTTDQAAWDPGHTRFRITGSISSGGA